MNILVNSLKCSVSLPNDVIVSPDEICSHMSARRRLLIDKKYLGGN